MDVDLRSQPVTDIHCFSFAQTKTQTRRSLAKLFMAGGPTVMSFNAGGQEKDLPSSLAYRRMVYELSRFLKCKNDELVVLKKRNERAKDFPKYVRTLFEDAKIERIALDNGLEPVQFEEFKKYAPSRLYRVYRVEPLVKRLLESTSAFGTLLDTFEESIGSAVKKEGFVGFKSVIAYRTGLDVGAPTEAEARAAFRTFKEGKEGKEWFGPKVKPLRGYLLRRVAEMSKKLGVFLQIHTGYGDTDIIADSCNPLLLQSFLKLESVSKTPVVLIHGGFPYTLEAAWLANVFPNVYFELSTPLPPYYFPALSKSRFRDVLETVPTSRIVYGSDSIETPENHWMSAKLAKKALGGALGDLVGEGIIDEDEAVKTGGRIFNSNALRLLR